MLKTLPGGLVSTKIEGPQVAQPDETKMAVLLNRNARRVTDKLAKRIERIIGKEHVYYSANLAEAEAYTREIVQRGYGTILSGGGDGSLCRAINLVQQYIDESNAWRTERFERYGEEQTLLGTPRFGFLRLGTGNGMSEVVGATNPIRDLKNIVDFAPGRTHKLNLIESKGERFFFAGLGYDSMLLNDYNALSDRPTGKLLKPFTQGLPGYFSALFTKTIPRILFGDTKIDGRVVNHGKAYYIDPRRGDAAIEVEPGSTLFEGKAAMIAAGTSPYYGYGFRIFPFSNIRPGMMHLRVATLGPVSTLANLGSIWKGHYRNHKNIMDFLVEDVRIELENPFPYQHSGDAQGMRREVELKVAAEPLRVVDCYRGR